MFYKNKRASIFVYVLILINVALIIGYVVFNTTYILNNNINIGKNAEEVFLKLSDKANINIESVRQYNANGGGYADFVSCPTNITMSGTTERETSISSEMHYDLGETYCLFRYEGEDVRLYFDDETHDFSTVYYDGELLNVVDKAFNTGNEISSSIESYTQQQSSSYQPSKSIDDNYNTQYKSKKDYKAEIVFDLGSEKKISKLLIYKKANNSSTYWSNGYIQFLDSSNHILKSTTITGARTDTYIEIDMGYSSYASADSVRYIKLVSNHTNSVLNVSEIEVYELIDSGNIEWTSERTFNDGDDTFLTFDETGIGGNDDIDDNMNSDNYRSSSTGSIGYPGDFMDDDITPRITIFGSVDPRTEDWFNVFWDNYLTEKLIDENTNNNDNPLSTVKLGEVDSGLLYFDLFSTTENLDYDFKMLIFDKDKYKNEYTLYPLNSYSTEGLTDEYGYLEFDTTTKDFSLSSFKTGNEFVFDFKNYDYALFFKNHGGENLAIRIIGEEETTDLNNKGKTIYINSIDDSSFGTIETITNHIIIGGEKNFIGENFKSSDIK